MESHLLQMRGLKLLLYSLRLLIIMSHLLQMRGLKHLCLNRKHHGHESHLLQMRGLKHAMPLKATPATCRIFYRCVD